MPANVSIEPGLAGSVPLTVTAEDTAIALGSGDVPVLGTPRVIALAEEAACLALAGTLAQEQTTVGVEVSLEHLRPTSVGGTVTASAVLDQVDGRKLAFVVQVVEGEHLVARGTHRRVIVPRNSFSA